MTGTAEPGVPETAGVVVVLVHAAWADGSSWNKVIAGLRSAGVKAVAVPLPLTTLADDVAALDRTLERVQGPVVVAGHAYSGAVIASTRHESVASLVYVTALAPDEGETVGDVYYWAEHHPEAPALGPDAHGLIWLPRGGVQQGVRPARDAARAGAAGRYAAAARGGLHQRPCPAAAVAGPAELVPRGGRGPDDPRRDPALHGGADEGAGPYGARRPRAHDHQSPAVVDVLLEAVREAESNRKPSLEEENSHG